LLTSIGRDPAVHPDCRWFQISTSLLCSPNSIQKFSLCGDNVAFWKPLSWTIIFGLAFAFFMTLIMVPSMYLIAERLRRPMQRMFGGKWISFMGIPPMIFPLYAAYDYTQHLYIEVMYYAEKEN
jgi:ABC-type Fe3+ transport system permease subunit